MPPLLLDAGGASAGEPFKPRGPTLGKGEVAAKASQGGDVARPVRPRGGGAGCCPPGEDARRRATATPFLPLEEQARDKARPRQRHHSLTGWGHGKADEARYSEARLRGWAGPPPGEDASRREAAVARATKSSELPKSVTSISRKGVLTIARSGKLSKVVASVKLSIAAMHP